MPGFFHSVCAVALLTALPAAALAAEGDDDTAVAEVVSTGTRDTTGIEADKVAASLTVIDSARFEERQVRIVSDVLRDVPGLSVSRTGGVGSLTQVRVRGAESNHVLTLIDGIEAADPFFGEFDFATLLADDVARLEVLRGQQSAIYGSDAIGGVINYITPTGRQSPGIRVRAEGGSMGTYGAAARAAGVNGGLDYVLSAGVQSADGYVVAPGGHQKIGSDLGALAAKFGYEVNPQLKLRAVARYTSTRADQNGQDFGTTGFALDSPGSGLTAVSAYGFLGADLSTLEGRWTHSLSVQGVNASRDNKTSGVRSGGDDGTRTKGSYATTFQIDGDMFTSKLTGAVDLEKETYKNTNPPSPFGADTTRRSVRNTGVVGQYDLGIGENVSLGAALRYDENDIFDNATTYRVQGAFKVNDMVRLRAAAGSGIKNPSQTELFGYNAGAFPFAGNPALKPEKSEGWEAGIDLSFKGGAVHLGATYFDTTLKDEIFDVFAAPLTLCTRPGLPPPFSCSTSGNRATQSHQTGIELFADARLSDAWSVNAAYTYLDADENGIEEIRRPPNIGSVNVTWHGAMDRLTLTGTVRYNGETLDSEFATFGRTTLKAFTLVNLAGSWKVNDKVEVFGRVENLFDQTYQEVYGFNTPGVAGYAGVRARF